MKNFIKTKMRVFFLKVMEFISHQERKYIELRCMLVLTKSSLV